MTDKVNHWQNVYATKSEQEFSWYQSYPTTSAQLIKEASIRRDEPIIDVGGGDSHLVDVLLQSGYTNLYVLDISSTAIERAKERLGRDATKVNWIVSDVTDFKSEIKFSVWHDRATFHFLNEAESIEKYQQVVSKSVNQSGKFILGTFSIKGPQRCSGIDVRQYSEQSMTKTFQRWFDKIRCFEEDHQTPFHTHQLFQFCFFERK